MMFMQSLNETSFRRKKGKLQKELLNFNLSVSGIMFITSA